MHTYLYKIFKLLMNENRSFKGSGKWSKVREKSVKSQGILKRILSGNPALVNSKESHTDGVLISAL